MKTNKVIFYFLFLLTPLSIFAQKMELIVPTGYKYNFAQFKLTPDGRFFIGVNGNDMVLWEAKTQRQLRTFKDIKSDGKINDFKISPNGKNIVVFMRFEVHCFELETGKKLWTSPKLEYENYSGSYFDNGNKIAVIGVTDGNIISAQTGAVISKVKGFEGHEGKTYTLPDDNILVASFDFYRIFNTKTGVLGEKIPVKLQTVSEKNYMGFALDESNIQVYDLKTNKIIKTIKLTVPDPNLGMTMEGDALLVVSQTADEYTNKTSTAKKYSLPQLTETNLKITDMLSKDVSGSSTYDIIWSGTGKMRRLSNSALVGDLTGQLMNFDAISGLTYVQSFWRKTQLVGFRTQTDYRVFDFKTGQIKGNISENNGDYISLSAISSDGKRWIGFFDSDKSLRYFNMETGKMIKKFPIEQVPDFYRDIFQLQVSDSHEILYWADKDKKPHEFDLKTGKSSDKIDFYEKENANDYVKTGYDFNLMNEKGNVSFGIKANRIDIVLNETKKTIGTYYSFKGTKDWVVVTPEGRYDGTPAAFKRMYYVRNTEVVSLDALFEKFYTPGLYQMLINGTPPPSLDEKVDDLKAAPVVKIGVPVQQRNLVVEDDKPSVRRYQMTGDKISLTIDATCEAGVTEIRLYHNGKLYGSGTRNLTVDDDTPEKKKAQTFDIQLIEGENLFKAIAVNTQKTESQPDEILVTYKAAKASKPQNTEGGITLHLVVIGINKYKNTKYNLNYASADATSFKESLTNISSTIFSKTNIAFIGDENATKEGIAKELEKIKTTATQKDVFIFYYAGHGVLNEKKEFFLVPHDVTQLYGNDKALAQKGLSANQLQQFSKDIKAQKQLFILDACQSAGALEQVVAQRGVGEEKAIAQLARSTGTHWLTASGSEQFASEFKQLGHGTFTYVLLEALSGKADVGGDKKLTVKELDAYLQEQVPEVTAKYKGTPQYPASYGFGNDFPIGIVKN